MTLFFLSVTVYISFHIPSLYPTVCSIEKYAENLMENHPDHSAQVPDE